MIRFRLLHIPFEVSFWYLAMMALLSLFDQTTAISWGVFSSLFHEACHVAVLLAFGIRPALVALEVSGIRMSQPQTLSFGRQACVLAAGCVGNIALFFLCLCLGWQTGATVNLCLCAFNLLPSCALDGGQLVLLFLERWFSWRTAFCILRVISAVLAVLLLALGGWVFLSCYNPTLLFTAFFVLFTAIFHPETA